jgi:hypothetical protein
LDSFKFESLVSCSAMLRYKQNGHYNRIQGRSHAPIYKWYGTLRTPRVLSLKHLRLYRAISIKVVHKQSGKVEYERERLLGTALKID